MKKIFGNSFCILKVLAVLIIILLFWFLYFRGIRPIQKNVFKDNLTYMEDAAKDYFTTYRLPQTVNESIKLSLSEMLEQKLIVPFTDKKGRECNKDESYVMVTKLEVGYELKTYLVCGKESNYTITTLGCHDYCNTCRNEKEVISYEYKKANNENITTYTCPSGYTRVGTKCNKYTSTSKNAILKSGTTSVETTNYIKSLYSGCENGYEPKQKGNSLVCQAQTTSIINYTCNNKCYEPREVNGTYVCVLKESSTCPANANPAQMIVSCASGSVLSDNKCYTLKDTGLLYTELYQYTCPSGYSKEGSGENTVCSKTVTTPSTYYCEDSSYTLSGKKCIKTVVSEQVNATSKSETKTTYEYKWSEETSLEGWERTGKQKSTLVEV